MKVFLRDWSPARQILGTKRGKENAFKSPAVRRTLEAGALVVSEEFTLSAQEAPREFAEEGLTVELRMSREDALFLRNALTGYLNACGWCNEEPLPGEPNCRGHRGMPARNQP